MLLFELNQNQLLVKLIAIISDIKHSLEHKEHRPKRWMESVESFLDYLSDHDIIIDREDLMSMIRDKKGPLSTIIDDIQGDEIVWRDSESTSADVDNAAADAEQQQIENDQIVANMADQALPK